MSGQGSSGDGEQRRGADTTQSGWSGSTIWSDLLLARQRSCPGAEEALQGLCHRYWPAVYAFVRRRGNNPSDAEDLTQAFFAHFLGNNVLAKLDPSKGRFRTFLLVIVKNFLANERDKALAEKRGGGKTPVSLDEISAEEGYCAAAPDLSPDELFGKRWALAVIKQVLNHLETQEAQEGRAAQFARLHIFLTEDGADDDYESAGAALGLSRKAVGMAVYRLRQRFAQILRAEIGATVPRGQVEEEVICLMAALSSS